MKSTQLALKEGKFYTMTYVSDLLAREYMLKPCMTAYELSVPTKKRWTEYLPEIVYVYNSTVHSSVGYSPYFLFLGRVPTLPIDLSLNEQKLKKYQCSIFHQKPIGNN